MIPSLLLVYPLLLLPSLALSSQTPLTPPPSHADYPPPAILTSTLVDVLSSDPEYSSLLRLLQRTRLIPTLNKLGNATLFAPTNDALARARSDPSSSLHHLFPLSSSSSLSSEDEDDGHTPTPFLDNVLFPLRQTLLYHILNFTLPSTSSPLFPSSGQPHSFETLLFPDSFSRNPTNNTAPAPPWLPAREGLLGGDGQRVRAFLSAQGEGEEKHQARLGVNWDGQGGWSVLGEPIVAGNGVVVKLDGVLEMPKDVGSTILAHPSLSYLSSLLLPASSIPPMPVPPQTYLSSLQTLANLTLFAPSNAAWSKLAPIERTYLESGFAGDDIELLVKLHAANDGVRVRKDGGATSAVGWRESFGEKGKGEVKTVGGGKVWIEVGKEGEMSIGLKGAGGDEDEGDKENEEDKEGGVQVIEPDILCENGERSKLFLLTSVEGS
jgi:solute carrier family 25 carnitine/acylcarnitine transporter 20/29